MEFRKITKSELKEILRKHQLWLNDEPDGERANLSYADLTRADLSGADLFGANLCYADLSGANLFRANLSGAKLTEANLYGANLCEANLCEADLSGADLFGANLSYADLSGADLTGTYLFGAKLTEANLSGADLFGANLCYANLSGADLSGANLSRANLFRADLSYADLSGATPQLLCPEKGSFIGYKKTCGDCIVELEIPEDALRSSATMRKCRCSKAKVLSITKLDGSSTDVEVVYSKYDSEFSYKVGDIVEVSDFDTNRWHECAPGIHFFITRDEAVEYEF